MRKSLFKGLAVLIAMSMLFTLWPATLSAEPPQPVKEGLGLAKPRYLKLLDEPNPFDANRLQNRERLLTRGRTAEAAALAKKGKDSLLVILVEFAGTDVVTWNPGDIWDPVADPTAVDFEAYGDCSNVITATQTFTYTGPLHNSLVKPTSKDHPGYNAMWTSDFNRDHYWNMLFGNGLYITYTLGSGEVATIDLRGKSLKAYYEEQSKGMYTVDGDVVGWVQVPHSEAWYGTDACPGAKSAGYSPISDGYFPEGGSPRSLAMDAVDAIIATHPDFDWARYDENGDGVLDRVMIVHAGYGEEDHEDLLVESGVGEMAIWSVSTTVYPFYPIGDSGYEIGPVTVMPENGMLGVFAHEFAHNLGCMDLYAYSLGDPSTGFWTLMNDDWGGGWPDSSVPPALDPWHKYLLGWNDPVVLDTTSPKAEVVLGQACSPPAGTADSVIVNLPAQVEQPVRPPTGSYMWWSGQSNLLDAQLALTAPLDLSAATAATLTFKTFYDIEEGWDFGFVQASTDGGTTWTSMPGTTTTSEHDPDCFFVPEMPGYTGYSGEWLNETVDVSSYKGKSNVLLRFRYETDPATLGLGWYLDDIAVTVNGQAVFSDGAETPSDKLVAQNWTRSDGFAVYPQYYIAEWRNACGFDAGLAGGRYHINDFGMLLWYRNSKYTDAEVFNHIADGPAFGPKGACLVVEAHFEPWRYPSTPYVNEAGNIPARIQMRDACFGLRDTLPWRLETRYLRGNPDEEFGSRPAVPGFHDSLGWYPGVELTMRGPSDPRVQWFTKEWDSSAVIPAKADYGVAPTDYPEGAALRFGGTAFPGGMSGWYWFPAGIGYGGTTGNPGKANYGVHIVVEKEAPDLSWGRVSIWNDTDTFLSWMKADKETTRPGDVLTYELYVKDAASSVALGSIDIPIPEGTTYVPGSLSGARYFLDTTDPQMAREHIVWGGPIGGKVLHTADARITYQVKVNPNVTGTIMNKAVVSIAGGKTYSVEAKTKSYAYVYFPVVLKRVHGPMP